MCESDTDRRCSWLLIRRLRRRSRPAVQPPAVQNNPPPARRRSAGAEPAEVPSQYGDAQWIRTFVTQLQRPINLDQLMADQPAVVPMDRRSSNPTTRSFRTNPPLAAGNRRHQAQPGHDRADNPRCRASRNLGFTGHATRSRTKHCART